MTYPVSVTRDIAASPEKVWALVTDLPRMGEWSPENQGGTWSASAPRASRSAFASATSPAGVDVACAFK